MKRYILWALFALAAIAAALLPSDPALAEDWAPIELLNPGAEPGAFGHATLTNVAGPGWWYDPNPNTYLTYELYAGDLSVDCGGLTPGKTYRIGPTVTPVPSRNSKQKVQYFSFTASPDGGGGTAGTPVRVQFYVTWAFLPDLNGGGDWYPMFPDVYRFSVARKVGKSWTDSLTGFFPKPNPTYPPPW